VKAPESPSSGYDQWIYLSSVTVPYEQRTMEKFLPLAIYVGYCSLEFLEPVK